MTKLIQFRDLISLAVGCLMLICGMLWFGLKLFEWTMKACAAYRMVCEYFWHREKFLKWLKENCKAGAGRVGE